MIVRYTIIVFSLLLFGLRGGVAAEYAPLNNLWSESSAGSVSNYGNPWRSQENGTSELQFVQPSGNPWLVGGRTQQATMPYTQPQAPQVMPQRRGARAWSSPQRFPFGWMP